MTSCLEWFYLNREIGSRILCQLCTTMYLFYYLFLFTSRYLALFVSICSTIQVKSLYVLHHRLFLSGAWLGWCCVELHCGTVLRDDFWPSFPRSLVISNKRNKGDQKHSHSAIRHNSYPHLTRNPSGKLVHKRRCPFVSWTRINEALKKRRQFTVSLCSFRRKAKNNS